MLNNITSWRKIRVNNRSKTYRGTYKNQAVFIKVAANKKLRNEEIWREAAGLEAMRELDPAASHYRVPRVLFAEGGTIVTTWAKGYLMANDFSKDDKNKISQHIDTLLGIFAFLDKKTTSATGITYWNQPGKMNGIDKTMRRLREVAYEKHVDKKLVDATAHYAQNLITKIETRFTHGDLQPGNIMVDGNTYSVIDCESCSWLWPRHYNIVNFVFNYSLRSEPWLNAMLELALYKYLEMTSTDIHTSVEQINFSACIRSIQVIYEVLGSRIEEARSELPKGMQQHLTRYMSNIAERRLFLKST